MACKKNVVRARTGGALGNATERVEVSGSESRLDWRQPEALVYPLHTPLPSPLPTLSMPMTQGVPSKIARAHNAFARQALQDFGHDVLLFCFVFC